MVRRKTHEEFVAEVEALVGDEYVVMGKYVNARTRVDIRHIACGKTNPMFPTSILGGKKCFECYGAHKKAHDTFVSEVVNKYGQSVIIRSHYESARKDILVECGVCGSTRHARAKNILSGDGCPVCEESKGERRIRTFLNSTGIPFIAQEAVKYCRENKPLKFDFFVQGVAIEYDGIQHYKPVGIFGGEMRFNRQRKLDDIKNKYCADNGIPLIRIPYWEYDNIDAILTKKLLPLLTQQHPRLVS